jgi:hypothetical protein
MTDCSRACKNVSYQEVPGEFRFPQRLAKFCQDLQDEGNWKYEKLPPVQLLEILKLGGCPMNRDERTHAEWIWSRRPRVLLATSIVLWLILIFGMPFLVGVPQVGLPLLTIWALTVGTEIVRSVRWRGDYERSIGRLIRISR